MILTRASRLLLLLSMIVFGCNIAESIVRFDPFAVLFVLGYYALKQEDRTHMLLFWTGTILNMVFDIVWLGVFGCSWHNSCGDTTTVTRTFQFAEVLTILCLFVKLFIIIFGVVTWRNMPHSSTSQRQYSFRPMEEETRGGQGGDVVGEEDAEEASRPTQV